MAKIYNIITPKNSMMMLLIKSLGQISYLSETVKQ